MYFFPTRQLMVFQIHKVGLLDSLEAAKNTIYQDIQGYKVHQCANVKKTDGEVNTVSCCFSSAGANMI